VARTTETTVAGVRLTNPGRVMYPEMGITKLKLAKFYEEIADWILPHIVGRPISLVRCPQGHQGQCFYQKHLSETMPEAVRGVPIREKDSDKTEDYLVIDDVRGLISLVQMGVLEIHPWGARYDKIEQPDVLTFDMDPGPGVQWVRMLEAALRLRLLLQDLKLESFVKTSGGKGLHVIVPIRRRGNWDEIKEFTRLVSEELVRRWPGEYLINMSKAKRPGKIFVDYLRNGRGATSVAAYSTRARAGAPVSTPIDWRELPKLKSAADFDVENLPARLRKLKKDPWADYFNTKQSIGVAVKRAVGL
jgi:bifunctional non-homologous end joining protein LigD